MEDWQKAYLIIGGVVAVSVIVLGASYLGTYLQAQESGGTLAVRDVVVQPSGTELVNETVHILQATPLAALNASADAHGFAVHLLNVQGSGTYVDAIDGTSNHGSHQWTFRVQRGGQWCWGIDAPNRYQLVDGDHVAWVYVNVSTTPAGC